MDLPQQLEALAIDIAREAGELARRRRTEGVAIAATKSSIADIVTEADREVEALIRARLVAERPGDGFLGEETDAERGTSGITWVVDPIDGTVNYAYGIPAYAVSIAAVRGEPSPDQWEALAGAVFSPPTGELFHAAHGAGSWLDGSATGRQRRNPRPRALCWRPDSATTRRHMPATSPGSRGSCRSRGICGASARHPSTSAYRRCGPVRRLLRARPAAVGPRRRSAAGHRGGGPIHEGRPRRHARTAAASWPQARDCSTACSRPRPAHE